MTDHLQKSATAVVILLVLLQVLGKSLNSVSEDRDLNLRGSGVAFVDLVLLNNCLLFVFRDHVFHLIKNLFRQHRLRRVNIVRHPSHRYSFNIISQIFPFVNTYGTSFLILLSILFYPPGSCRKISSDLWDTAQDGDRPRQDEHRTEHALYHILRQNRGKVDADP